MNKWLKDFKKARLVSTPLIGITTPDWSAAQSAVVSLVGDDIPCFSVDCVRGLVGLNEQGILQADLIPGSPDMMDRTKDVAWTLSRALAEMPDGGILFLLNAHLYIDKLPVIQAICLMRDVFKLDMRQLVMLAPALTLPAELAQDVMLLDEPLPDDKQLLELTQAIYKQAKEHLGDDLQELTDEVATRCVEAARGLSMAGADQAFAFSLDLDAGRMDIDEIWNRKKGQIQQTPGITFWQGSETYNDIGGLDEIKLWFERLNAGPHPLNCIVFIDEIEKHTGGDGSYQGDGGVQQGMKGTLLSTMEDEGWGGMIAVGPPGTCKSYFARATGTTFGIPTICLDLGATKGGIVGESERRIRQAMKVIKAIAGKGAFWIATSNNITTVAPELLRRFELGGTWFFDLPTPEEQPSIWTLNLERFGLPTDSKLPPHDEWTGANIRDCCKKAWALGIPLVEAANQIVPISRKDPELVDRLRRAASNNWLSTSHAGTYTYRNIEAPRPAPKVTGQRRIGLRS
jgi:hypothetical protein